MFYLTVKVVYFHCKGELRLDIRRPRRRESCNSDVIGKGGLKITKKDLDKCLQSLRKIFQLGDDSSASSPLKNYIYQMHSKLSHKHYTFPVVDQINTAELKQPP